MALSQEELNVFKQYIELLAEIEEGSSDNV